MVRPCDFHQGRQRGRWNEYGKRSQQRKIKSIHLGESVDLACRRLAELVLRLERLQPAQLPLHHQQKQNDAGRGRDHPAYELRLRFHSLVHSMLRMLR